MSITPVTLMEDTLRLEENGEIIIPAATGRKSLRVASCDAFPYIFRD